MILRPCALRHARFFLLLALITASGRSQAFAQPATAVPATTINTGLQAYYSFDGAGHDDSPWARNLSIAPPLQLDSSGGARTLRLDLPNSSLKLDDLGFPLTTPSYSVAGWIKVDLDQRARESVLVEAFGGIGVVSDTHEVVFTFFATGATGARPMLTPINTRKFLIPGRWTHVAVTYDGPTRSLRIYMDGVAIWPGADDPKINIAGPSMPVFPAYLGSNLRQVQWPDQNGQQRALHGNIDKIMLHDRVLSPEEVVFLANRGNINPPDYVVRFAPELRFTQNSGAFGYPMSAQPFFDLLDKDSNGYPISKPGSTPVGIENTNISTLQRNTIPTYFQERIVGDQIRVSYWWFYGYQHPCIPIGAPQSAHNGDWEHMVVVLKEDRSGVSAVSYYQHNNHYTRIAGIHGPCSPVNIGRCNGSGGFEMSGTHPVAYVGRASHGNFHDANRWLPGADKNEHNVFECIYYGDYRDPDSNADYFDSSRSLIDLDGNKEAWLAKDRGSVDWKWGPEGSFVGTHPTRQSPLDDEHRAACEGAPTYLWKSAGCFKSECIAGDDEASEDCLKECLPGYTNVGLTCNKGVWPWDWKIYGRLTGGNKYNYNYQIPTTDAGLTRRRSSDAEWDKIP
jgi:hypothetical protein